MIRPKKRLRRAAPKRRSRPVQRRRRAPKARRPAAKRRARSVKRSRVSKRPSRRPAPKQRARSVERGRDLKGHVDLVGLGNLLQLLAMHKTEGVLSVTKGREKQSIHLGPDGIRLLSSSVPRVRRLSRLATKLSGRTLITPERLKNLLGREKLLGWTLGQALFANEQLSSERIHEALRHQVEEEILDLFVWEKAMFAFQEVRPSRAQLGSPLAGLPIRADVTALLLEAARRSDELLQIRRSLPDEGTKVQKLAREIHADELGEDVVRVDAILPLINGHRTLKAILQASIYPRFATMRAVHKLLKLGYAKAKDRAGQTVVLPAMSGPV